MLTDLHHDGEVNLRDTERCCFCRAHTHTWTNLPDRQPGQQVACCEACARVADPVDVPTKKAWMRAEEIALLGPWGGPVRPVGRALTKR